MNDVVEIAEQTDEALIAEAAREGSDGPAFVALIARHQQRVWRICYRLLGNEHDAADAAQEVFVRLYLKRNAFAGRSRFTTWLHGMALRVCLGLRRSRARRQRRETMAAVQRPTQSASPDPATLDLLEMLDILDDEDRALLILKYAEQYTIDELSEMFDLSASACKMRLSRARGKLRAQFGRDF